MHTLLMHAKYPHEPVHSRRPPRGLSFRMILSILRKGSPRPTYWSRAGPGG
jgi:hypothetical protein